MGLFKTLLTWLQRRPPARLTCPASVWQNLLSELRNRGHGEIESGAFLLGHKIGNQRKIQAFIPYDEIDPNCLQGGILFDGSRMDLVWARCRALNMDVIADVHTHPGGHGQSSIDRANPMMPERGHIALIIPNFADINYGPGAIGIYEFCGADGWRTHSHLGRDFFKVGGFSL